MPPQVGGFWLREAALYDGSGSALAVASLPPSYKPMLAEDRGERLWPLYIWFAVSSVPSVWSWKADPSVILASVAEVNKAKDEAKGLYRIVA